MTQDEIKECARKLAERLKTPEGQESMRKAAEASRKRIEESRHRMQTDWERVRKRIDYISR